MVEGRAEGVVSRAGLRGIKGIKRDFAGLSGEGVGSGGFSGILWDLLGEGSIGREFLGFCKRDLPAEGSIGRDYLGFCKRDLPGEGGIGRDLPEFGAFMVV